MNIARFLIHVSVWLALIATGPAAGMAHAQGQGADAGIRAFVTAGSITFHARESFDAILGTPTGPIVGGGVQVLLPRGFYAEASAARFSASGERAFIGPGGELFRLGIPVRVSITPLEITGGWRWRRNPRVVPYGGIGFSSYRYREASDHANAGDDVSERFAGVHMVGGVELRAMRRLALGGEIVWSSIPGALGESGVSEAFDESNLGGTGVRLKIGVGF
jgi:hypothetical protein